MTQFACTDLEAGALGLFLALVLLWETWYEVLGLRPGLTLPPKVEGISSHCTT